MNGYVAVENRVPEPVESDYFLMTPLRFQRLSTNTSTSQDVRFTGSITSQSVTITGVSLRVGMFSSLDGCSNLYQNAATFAYNHGIQKVAGHEGCYSPDYIGTTQVNGLRARSRWGANMQAYAKAKYDNFFAAATNAGLSGMTMEFPSPLLPTGQYPTGNAWQTLEDIYATPQPPQWLEAIAYPN